MSKTSHMWKLLNHDPAEWDVPTYEAAKQLVRSMRASGVPETDSNLIHFIEKIGEYHRAQFWAATVCGSDLTALLD